MRGFSAVSLLVLGCAVDMVRGAPVGAAPGGAPEGKPEDGDHDVHGPKGPEDGSEQEVAVVQPVAILMDNGDVVPLPVGSMEEDESHVAAQAMPPPAGYPYSPYYGGYGYPAAYGAMAMSPYGAPMPGMDGSPQRHMTQRGYGGYGYQPASYSYGYGIPYSAYGMRASIAEYPPVPGIPPIPGMPLPGMPLPPIGLPELPLDPGFPGGPMFPPPVSTPFFGKRLFNKGGYGKSFFNKSGYGKGYMNKSSFKKGGYPQTTVIHTESPIIEQPIYRPPIPQQPIYRPPPTQLPSRPHAQPLYDSRISTTGLGPQAYYPQLPSHITCPAGMNCTSKSYYVPAAAPTTYTTVTTNTGGRKFKGYGKRKYGF